ncbi:uncharacterized protein LOC111273663 isoform X2 [Varroa jacobsoni]|uniref:uncharacterized protein LOC111273663 isoform X2 n=1 Tax=Varroa jacobsoni TaxID=62625 RepID=UPI000BF881DD|nr:uncharacterized protein LOC111273663 isoform X2 [Varroa jacobsoni]
MRQAACLSYGGRSTRLLPNVTAVVCALAFVWWRYNRPSPIYYVTMASLEYYSSIVMKSACILVTMYLLAAAAPSEAIPAHKIIRLVLFKGFLKRPIHIPVPLPLPIPVRKDTHDRRTSKFPTIKVSIGHKKHDPKYHVYDINHLHGHSVQGHHHVSSISDVPLGPSFGSITPTPVHLPIIEPSLPRFAGTASRTSVAGAEPFLPIDLEKKLSDTLLDHAPAPLIDDFQDENYSGLAAETQSIPTDSIISPLSKIPPVEDKLESASPIKVASLASNTAFLKQTADASGPFGLTSSASVNFHDSLSSPSLLRSFSEPEFAVPAIGRSGHKGPIDISPIAPIKKVASADSLSLAAGLDFTSAGHFSSRKFGIESHDFFGSNLQDLGLFHRPVPLVKDDLQLADLVDGKISKYRAA